jgi:hypothetical protein
MMDTALKLMLIILGEEQRDRVESILVDHGVGGFSELAHVLGEGRGQRRFESALYPGANAMILSVLPGEQVPVVRDALLAVFGAAAVAGTGMNPLRIAVLPVEQFI